MTDKADVKFEKDSDGIYDIAIGEDGDLDYVSGYETSIHMSVETNALADATEIENVLMREGWIGNENNDDQNFELGSKLHLKLQSRATTLDKNEAVNYVRLALSHFVPDRAKSIDVTGNLTQHGISVTANILRHDNTIDKVLFELWDKTESTT